MEVWLDEGKARGTPQQLLNPDLTLKENFRNKTITEFPVLTVLSKGAGPPHTEPRPIQSERPGPPHTEPLPVQSEGAGLPHTEPHPIQSEGAGPRHDSDWSGSEEGEIVSSASLRMIANIYSDTDNDSS